MDNLLAIGVCSHPRGEWSGLKEPLEREVGQLRVIFIEVLLFVHQINNESVHGITWSSRPHRQRQKSRPPCPFYLDRKTYSG